MQVPGMNYEQAEALGRRALAAGWVWSGVEWSSHEDATASWRHGAAAVLRIWPPAPWPDDDDWEVEKVPDFRDAATRGILLELVRERRKNRHLYVAPEGDHWVVWDGFGECDGEPEPSEPEALIAVLESAQEIDNRLKSLCNVSLVGSAHEQA